MALNLQQSSSPMARRVVLVALLAVSLALATLYAREGQDGPIHGIQNAIGGAGASVASVGAPIGGATQAAGDALADATANPATLSALREQNDELRRLLSDAEEYRQETNRLQALLNMKQSSGVTGPVAHVIGRSVSAWDQSITIDLGADEEISGGMTVMGAGGVIGQVSNVQAHTSTVRLLTDPNSGAAVMIQSTRANGIVRGSMSGLLYLEDLDEGVIPEEGDVIVTSGLGGSYERGLVVGSVVSVNKTETDAGGSIIVDPNGDASLLEEVIVVFSAPDVAAAEKAKEEAEAQKAAQAAAAQEAQDDSDDDYAEGYDPYADAAADGSYDDYGYGDGAGYDGSYDDQSGWEG